MRKVFRTAAAATICILAAGCSKGDLAIDGSYYPESYPTTGPEADFEMPQEQPKVHGLHSISDTRSLLKRPAYRLHLRCHRQQNSKRAPSSHSQQASLPTE